MMQPSPRRFRFSTDDLPSKERYELYRERLLQRHMHLEFVDRSASPFRMAGDIRNFGPVTAGLVRGTASSYVRTRRNRSDGRDLFAFLIHRTGRYQVEGVRGHAGVTTDGAFFLSSRDEFAFHSLDGGSGWSISLDRAALEPLLAGTGEPLACRVPADTPALRLLTGYLETLFSIEQDCDPVLTAAHIGDLVLNALGVRGDAQALARERGVAAARQRAILDCIAGHAGEPGLDPASVAHRSGVSVSYLHRLLEPTGRSFGEHLLGARLERAAAMLRDPRASALKIAEIAAKAGFADISHFNRSFRRAFGDTPFGMRVRAARRAATEAAPSAAFTPGDAGAAA